MTTDIPQSGFKGFSLCHLNCRSLYKKLDEIKYEFNPFDFLGLTESWLHFQHDPALLHWTGKNYHRLDRKEKGGGIICYINQRISPTPRFLRNFPLLVKTLNV